MGQTDNALLREIARNTSSGTGGGGTTGGATETTLLEVRNRLPSVLVGDRLKVDVSSLTVTVDNAQLEIANDSGNPIPIAASALPLPAGAATNAKLDELRDRLPNSKWFRLQNADDLATAITYLDAGTADERINTVTYSSASLVLSAVETYSYAGTTGLYRLTGTVRS